MNCDVDKMTDDQFRQYVRTVALYFAERSYKRDHPRCSADDAWRNAVETWRNFEELALDFVSARQVKREIDLLRN